MNTPSLHTSTPTIRIESLLKDLKALIELIFPNIPVAENTANRNRELVAKLLREDGEHGGYTTPGDREEQRDKVYFVDSGEYIYRSAKMVEYLGGLDIYLQLSKDDLGVAERIYDKYERAIERINSELNADRY